MTFMNDMRTEAQPFEPTGFFGQILKFFSGVIAVLSASTRRRGQPQVLAHCDDRLLRDMGLTRSDISAALYGPIIADPARMLMDARRENFRAGRN